MKKFNNLCDSCTRKIPECHPTKCTFSSDSPHGDKSDDSVIDCSGYTNKDGKISNVSEFVESVKTRMGKNAFLGKRTGNEYVSYKLFSEIGEIIGSYAKQKFQGQPGNLMEEIGDALWYCYAWQIHNGVGLSLQNGVLSCFSIGEIMSDLAMKATFMVNNFDEEEVSLTSVMTISVIIDQLMTLCEMSGFTYLEAMQENKIKLDKRHGINKFDTTYYTGKNGNRCVSVDCNNEAETNSDMCSECNWLINHPKINYEVSSEQ